MALFSKPAFIISLGVSLLVHGVLITWFLSETPHKSKTHSQYQTIKVKINNTTHYKKAQQEVTQDQPKIVSSNFLKQKQYKHSPIKLIAKSQVSIKKKNTNNSNNTQAVIFNNTLHQSKENYLSKLRAAISNSQYYPTRARRMRIEGMPWVQFLIYNDGHIEKITISKSSGKSILDRAAKRSILKFGNFHAFPRNIRTSYLTVILPMQYKLD